MFNLEVDLPIHYSQIYFYIKTDSCCSPGEFSLSLSHFVSVVINRIVILSTDILIGTCSFLDIFRDNHVKVNV
jgi:hypothetical protein